MVTILVVLCIPLPVIWKLSISKPRKVGLGLSFTIGALYVFADDLSSCLVADLTVFVYQASSDSLLYSTLTTRTWSVSSFVSNFDTSFGISDHENIGTSALPQLWSCVEVSIGVISACNPSLTPLLLMLIGKYHGGSKRSNVSSSRHRETKSKTVQLDRIENLGKHHPDSQSLELILRSHNINIDRTNASSSIEDGIPGIMVTHQINQVSNLRSQQSNHAQGAVVATAASA